MSAPRVGLRVARRVASTGLAALVFVLALVAGVLVHLGAAPARRVVVRMLPAALDGAFPGKLEVRGIGGLSAYGVGGVDVDLVHPDGGVVARCRGVEATLDTPRLVRSLLGTAAIEIPIRSVSVRALDLDVSMNGGNLRLADVFVDPTEPETPDDPNARAVDVNIGAIEIGHAWVHGTIEADGPRVDADLDEVRASFAVDAESMRVGLVRADVTTRSAPRGADFRGRVSGAFDMPGEPAPGEPAQAAFAFVHGAVAASPLSAVAILRGDGVHAWVWLPELTPSRLAALAPEAPALAEPAAVTAVVDGTFDRLTGRALVAAGSSRVDVVVDAAFAPALVAEARLHATHLDASLVGGPTTDVSLEARAKVELPNGGEPKGEADLTTEPGVVAGIPVPAVVASATFAGSTARARAVALEPGMEATVVAEVKPGPKGTVVDARLDVPEADLAALARRGFAARGRAQVEVRAHADLGAETVAATARVAASGLAAEVVPGASVGSVHLDARVEGALANPEVRARAWVREATFAERDVRWATLSIEGPAMSPLVVAEVSSLDVPHLRARARVDVRGGPTLEDVRIEAERGTTAARLEVARVVLGAGIPALRDMRLTGVGEPMSLSVTPERGATRIVAAAPGLSLAALAELSGLDLGVRRGEVAIDGDVSVAPSRIDGKIDVHVRDVDVRRRDLTIRKLDGSVLAEVRGREIDLSIDGETTDLGRLHVKSRRTIVLSGPPAEVASWREATGALEIEADLQLAAIARLVPADLLPVRDVEGRVLVRGDVGREARAAAPSLDLAVETRELAVVGKPPPPSPGPDDALASVAPREPDASRMTPPQSLPTEPELVDPRRGRGRRLRESPVAAWTMRGVDFSLVARATPDPPAVALDLVIRDPRGELLVMNASSPLDYGRFVAGEPLALTAIETTPLSAKLSIPARQIDELPPVLGVPGTAGHVVLDVTFGGTLKDPKVSVDGGLGQLSIRDSPLERPFAVKLLADYDGGRIDAHLALDQDGARLLQARGDARVAMRDLLHPPPGELPWTASADVRLGPLPLDVLEAIMPAKIDGIAEGHVKLANLHEDAELEADVRVAGLVLGRVPHREASVRVVAKDGRVDAAVRMAQPDGSLAAEAKVGIAWGDRVVPELRAGEAFDVAVRAKTFRLRAVEPFLSSVLNRLDGRLDGDVRLSKEALTEAAKGRGVRGKLALSQGTVEVAAGGGPLDDVRATVRIDENGMVRLDDVFARGTTGEVRAAGLATFGDVGFQAARLHVVIPKDKPMPLLLSGEHLADVSANVKVAADMIDEGRELRVGVDIPRLQVELPDSLPDGVQTLDDIERVRIGTFRRGRFILLPTDAPDPAPEESSSTFRTRLSIALREARIVKGDMLSTYVQGNPVLLVEGGEATMSGAVKLRGGRVDIKGRRFEIESGTVTFTGDPANPNVILTATWRAPDDTTIFADFVGPVATGKVTLRSDPPRSREEILALVIFGRAEGYSSGGQQADKGTQAVGVAGGFATEGLNKVLDDVTDLEIRTRVDTSSSTNPRPELEVQISREIAARIAYVLGQIQPGQAPDKTYGTIDWSFRPEWSLETTVGDRASTTVDMIWEHRY